MLSQLYHLFFIPEAVNVGDGISWRFMAANVEGSTTIGTQTLVPRLGCRDHPEKTPKVDLEHLGVSINGGTPKSSILIGFSIINHPFWGTSIFGNTHFNHFFFFLCMEYNNYILNNYRLSFQFERNYWKGFMPSPPHENMAQVFQVFFFFSLVPGAWSISSTHLHPSARGQVGGIGFLCCEFGWENERPGKRYE